MNKLLNFSKNINKLPTTKLIYSNNNIVSIINKNIFSHTNYYNNNNITPLSIPITSSSSSSLSIKSYYSTTNKRLGSFKKPSFKTYSERNKKLIKSKFEQYGLCNELLESIKNNQWDKPTPIQAEVIPMIFKGRNVVFSSVTGSGKTAAYSLPFIQILLTFKKNKLNYLKKQREDQLNGIITDDNDQQNYQLFNKEDQGDDNENYNIEEEHHQQQQEEEQEEENKFIVKEKLNIEEDLNDDYFEIEDEFDDQGNLKEKIEQQEKSIQHYERLKKLKERNIKKPFNETDPIGLILLPSKELVIQVGKEINRLVGNLTIEESEVEGGDKLRVLTVMGGIGESKQIESLKNGVDIIIATPGRIVQLINQDVLSLQQVRMTVVDEFDKLFNLGFFPDIKEIFDFLPKVRSRTKPFSMQTVLTSATLSHSSKLDKMLTRFAPNHLMANQNSTLTAPETVKQHFYYVNYRQKTHLLLYFLRRGGKTSLKNIKSLVFARTQQRVEKITKTLQDSKINAFSIHADMSIAQRNDVLDQFKQSESGVLVCTDVMTRGVHIDHLDAVVNFDVPHVSEDYIHRIGRVGRIGSTNVEGFSLTFVSPDRLIFKIGERVVGLDETHLIKNIEKSTGIISKFSKIPGPWRGLDDGQHQSGQGSIITKRATNNNFIDDENLNDHQEEEEEGYDNDQDEYDQEDDDNNKSLPIIKNSNKEELFQNKQEKKAVAELLIKKKVLETYRGPITKDGLPRVRFNPNAKVRDSKISKIIVDRKGQIHDLPNLTDFKEGQYHQILDDFDRKRAIKRGVGLPEKKTHIFLPSKIETKRAIKNIEKNPSRFKKTK